MKQPGYGASAGVALVQLLLLSLALVLVIAVGYLLLAQPPQPAIAPEPVLVRPPPIQTDSTGSLAAVATSSSEALRPKQIERPDQPKPLVEPQADLPELNMSDNRFRPALAELSPSGLLLEWLIDEELIRKLVVTIDNMAEGRIPRKHSLLLPMIDKFRPSQQGDQVWLDGYNFSRYNAYIEAFESIASDDWVQLYRQYYPLMQQAYAELGYPRRQFHARVLQALDHLLQSPVIPRALALEQPSVMYTYADPKLEQLSGVHKQMLRIGPVNSTRLLDRLRVLRAALSQLQHES